MSTHNFASSADKTCNQALAWRQTRPSDHILSLVCRSRYPFDCSTLVEDSYFGSGHGTSIGSLGAGTVLNNITVRNVVFHGTTQAIRIKSDCGSSGSLTDVTFGPNISCINVGQTILVTAFYPQHGPGPCKPPSTLAISNVTFTGISSVNAGSAGDLWCDKGTPCTGMVFSDVTHTNAKSGWACQAFEGSADNVSPPLPSGCLSSW